MCHTYLSLRADAAEAVRHPTPAISTSDPRRKETVGLGSSIAIHWAEPRMRAPREVTSWGSRDCWEDPGPKPIGLRPGASRATWSARCPARQSGGTQGRCQLTTARSPRRAHTLVATGTHAHFFCVCSRAVGSPPRFVMSRSRSVGSILDTNSAPETMYRQ